MVVNELINYLVSKEYAVIVDNKAILTSKFYEVFLPPNTTVIQYATPTINQVLTSAVQNYNNTTIEEKKQIWNQFCIDAEVPFRVKAPGGGEYTVKHYSKPAVDKLISILKNKEIDYKRFCESTKHYYKTIAYKLTLQRYLCEEVWFDEYKNWSKESLKKQPRNDGSNWAEDT